MEIGAHGLGKGLGELHDLRRLDEGAFHQGGIQEHVQGGATVEDVPIGHHHEALGEVGDDLHIMADHNDGTAPVRHLADRVHHGHAFTVVET